MTNFFTVYERDSEFIVKWKDTYKINSIINKHPLLDVIFKEVKSNEAGLLIDTNTPQSYEILHLDYLAWASDVTKEYSMYLQRMYNISGVTFKSRKETDVFVEYMSKKLMWKILKD